MSVLLAIVVVGVGTYLSRAGFILALAKRRIPESVLVPLQYVAPAVLSALVVALLIDEEGGVAIGASELAAFLVAGVVARLTRNHILTLLAGMGVFWLVRALL
ncbi:MAG: AzlD domain-containing protein [Acidimicrobiia bacterium]